MTPKEKALEIVNRFVDVKILKDYEGMDFELAKQCALIAVDEILNQINNWGILSVKTYWIGVKQEIEKL